MTLHLFYSCSEGGLEIVHVDLLGHQVYCFQLSTLEQAPFLLHHAPPTLPSLPFRRVTSSCIDFYLSLCSCKSMNFRNHRCFLPSRTSQASNHAQHLFPYLCNLSQPFCISPTTISYAYTLTMSHSAHCSAPIHCISLSFLLGICTAPIIAHA